MIRTGKPLLDMFPVHRAQKLVPLLWNHIDGTVSPHLCGIIQLFPKTLAHHCSGVRIGIQLQDFHSVIFHIKIVNSGPSARSVLSSPMADQEARSGYNGAKSMSVTRYLPYNTEHKHLTNACIFFAALTKKRGSGHLPGSSKIKHLLF